MSKHSIKVSVSLDRALIENRIKQGSKKGLHMALDHLAAVSKQQVPLNQGTLKNSCYVDVASDGLSGTVSYDTPYAVRQHEVTWYQHQRGRKAKYLEDPVNDSKVLQQMDELIQRGMESELGG